MPTATDLMGLGVPASQAGALGNQPSALTATGTTQGGAALALTKNVTITAASSQTGVLLRSDSEIGSANYFSNPSATTALIYAPASQTLNGAASTTPYTLPQNKSVVFFQSAKGVWITVPPA